MKVYFSGPEPKTYHPELGKLIKDKVFNLPAAAARAYINGGLLQEVKSTSRRKRQTTTAKEE